MYNQGEMNRPGAEKNSQVDYRTPFRRDVARVIHCQGMRRLARKTQLFPCEQSDYFRTRLTHSMEVSQIATSIALKMNKSLDRTMQIDLDLVELAGWAHDLGHPPFGHQGEEMLAESMRDHGGFEGNAQTLRLVGRLEKKIHNGDLSRGGFDQNGNDKRFGLNLTYRSLASILKYDLDISEVLRTTTKDTKVIKGFYESERDLVATIKERVAGKNYSGAFKTIECDIMDVADDITYSTYDLEDAFKSGFITPIDMLIQNESFYQQISDHIANMHIINAPLTKQDIINILSDLIKFIFDLPNELLHGIDKLKREDLSQEEYLFLGQQYSSKYNQIIVKNAYARSDFSSQLVESSIAGLSLELNNKIPALSKVKIELPTRIRIEILKQIAFMTQVHSPRLKTLERRGRRIVDEIFRSLTPVGDKVPELLPDDFKIIYLQKMNNKRHRYRTICDYIACMTDRYALEFYSRISSADPSSFFNTLW